MILDIDLEETNIRDLKIERTDSGNTVEFFVEGKIRNVDEEALQKAFTAQKLRPIAIQLEAETGSG